MRIEFKAAKDADGIQMTSGAIGILSFKDDVFSVKVNNYTVQFTKVEMQRLSTIFGYTNKGPLH